MSDPSTGEGPRSAPQAPATAAAAPVADARDALAYAEAILATVRHPLLILDQDLRVERVNRAFLDLFEASAEDTVGYKLQTLGTGAWDVPALRSLLEEVIPRDGQVQDFEVHHDFDNVGLRTMLVNARRLDVQGRDEHRILIAFEDVTARREAEQAMRGYARDLERSNEELERFAYVASHDLQEPLRAISGFLQLLEKRYAHALDERGLHYIARATGASERMKALINDLLAYSRVERRAGPPEPVALGELLEEVVHLLQPAIEQADAEVTWQDLPTVVGDPGQLGQVLQNLVANAIKFARQGVPPEVHVAAEPTEGGWEITVTDNGEGIPEARLEDVFLMFRRLSPRREVEGTGIGLALCKRIVQRHGGKIWATSIHEDAAGPKATPGTTLHFTLPDKDDDAP